MGLAKRLKKNNLRSKDDVWTVVLSESPWTANRRSRSELFQTHRGFRSFFFFGGGGSLEKFRFIFFLFRPTLS